MRKVPVIDMSECNDCESCLELCPTIFRRNPETGHIEVVDLDEYPEDKLIDSIIIESIYEYIETNLSEKEVTVFKLKYYYRLNQEEISQVVESSVATVSRILSKITNELAERFPDVL